MGRELRKAGQPQNLDARRMVASDSYASTSGYWRSSSDVWAHTLAVTGPIAEKNLGDALHVLGRPDDALAHLQNAATMQSADPARHIDLAEDLAECGRLPEAVAEYEEAIRLTGEPASKLALTEASQFCTASSENTPRLARAIAKYRALILNLEMS